MGFLSLLLARNPLFLSPSFTEAFTRSFRNYYLARNTESIASHEKILVIFFLMSNPLSAPKINSLREAKACVPRK